MLKSLRPGLIEKIPRIAHTAGNAKVWVEAYGCSASMSDSEIMRGLLQQAGFELAASQDESALSVIVTCSVKDKSEHRMVSRMRSLSKSGKPVVVAGCLPKADMARVESVVPSASMLGPSSVDRIAEVASSALSGTRQVLLQEGNADKVNIPKVRLNPAVSIVQIGSGCLSECSFCQTKLAKGVLRSYRIGDIVRQVKTDIEDGCSEVWLTSTDNGCYGRDLGSDLTELLSACSDIPGDFKIRLGMLNPAYLPGMLDRMANLFAENDKLFKFIHIPVESGSGRILRLMKRGNSPRSFKESVRVLRKRVPELTVATDIIVGFPSETERDFELSLDLVSDIQPDVVNISRYGARPGTAAQKLKGRPSSQVAKQRSKRLHALAGDVARARNSRWMGWQGQVLVDELAKDGSVVGRNHAYKSVLVKGALGLGLGDRLRVKVYDYSKFSLHGLLVPE